MAKNRLYAASWYLYPKWQRVSYWVLYAILGVAVLWKLILQTAEAITGQDYSRLLPLAPYIGGGAGVLSLVLGVYMLISGRAAHRLRRRENGEVGASPSPGFLIAMGLVTLSALVFLLLKGEAAEPRQDHAEGVSVARELERANELSANKSELQIQGYMRRMGYDSLESNGQGMYFRIEGTPIGQRADEGVKVAIAYRAELLDGTLCREAVK